MADIYFTDVVLLVHADGAQWDTTFTDVSTSAKTVTAVDTASIDASMSPFAGGSSLYLDGAGGGASLSVPDSADFDFGSGDFTIEGWAYISNPTNGFDQQLFAKWTGGGVGVFSVFVENTTGNPYFYASSDGSTWDMTTSTPAAPLDPNTWYHIATVRSGTDFYLFVNGALAGSGSLTGALTTNTEPFTIGATSGGLSCVGGYMDEFRVTKGIARYTTTFTAPTAPFELGGSGVADLAADVLAEATAVSDLDVYTPGPVDLAANVLAEATVTADLTIRPFAASAAAAATMTARLSIGLRAASTAVATSAAALSRVPTDEHFTDVLLLLHADGTDGSHTFVDSSSYARTLTSTGTSNQAVIRTAQSMFGGASMNVPTSDGYLTTTSSDFFLGTGDFTIEFWARPQSGTSTIGTVLTLNNPAMVVMFRVTSAGVPSVIIGVDGSYSPITGGGTVLTAGSALTPIDNWAHWALVRHGSVIYAFIDGAMVDSNSISGPFNTGSAQSLFVGASGDGSLYYKGYLDDVRITKGVARYTSAFSRPTEAFPDIARPTTGGTVLLDATPAAVATASAVATVILRVIVHDDLAANVSVVASASASALNLNLLAEPVTFHIDVVASASAALTQATPLSAAAAASATATADAATATTLKPLAGAPAAGASTTSGLLIGVTLAASAATTASAAAATTQQAPLSASPACSGSATTTLGLGVPLTAVPGAAASAVAATQSAVPLAGSPQVVASATAANYLAVPLSSTSAAAASASATIFIDKAMACAAAAQASTASVFLIAGIMAAVARAQASSSPNLTVDSYAYDPGRRVFVRQEVRRMIVPDDARALTPTA